MFSRSAFRSVRVPPLPEGFPNSDAARGKEKDQNEKEEGEPKDSPPSSSTLGASRSETPIAGGVHPQHPLIGSIVGGSAESMDKNASPDYSDVPAGKATASSAQTSILDEVVALMHSKIDAHAGQTTEGKDPNQAQDVGVIAARGERSTDMVQKSALEEATEFPRDKLCIGWGERVWDDLSEVTIYPMIGITRSDEAIIVRVKDLVRPTPHIIDSRSTDWKSSVPVFQDKTSH